MAVFPYLRTKLELYLMTWYTGGHTVGGPDASSVFNIPDADIPVQLSSQTRENFEVQYRNWCNVFHYSTAPGVIEFKRKLRLVYPQMLDSHIAKEIAFLHCILNNTHHGPTGIEASELIDDSEKLINALKSWNIGDQVLLNVTKVFEDVTSSRNL